MNGIAGYAGAIVSPALTLAIDSTRRFLQKRDANAVPSTWCVDKAAFPNWPGFEPSEVDDGAQLMKWQPDCRATVLAFEALSGLVFEPASSGLRGKKSDGGRLSTWMTPTTTKGGAMPLVEMMRPETVVLEQQAQRVVEAQCVRLQLKSDDMASRDRLTEIAAQVVPPFAFWASALPIHPDRMPRTIELIELTLTLASFAEQRFKHALAVARPNVINPNVFPAILTPAHASLPSGHATESFAVANVLLSLFGYARRGSQGRRIRPKGIPTNSPSLQDVLMRLAARIADNRQVAGLHYPIDTLAGRLLGTVLADYLVARCTGASCSTGHFKGAHLNVEDGKAGRSLTGVADEALEGPDEAGLGLEKGLQVKTIGFARTGTTVTKSSALAWLWDRARQEWGARKLV